MSHALGAVLALILPGAAGCAGSQSPATPVVDAAPAAAPVAEPAAPLVPGQGCPPATEAEVPTQLGTYVSGEWTYTIAITAKGSKSQGTLGTLSLGEQSVLAFDGATKCTPWGALVFSDPGVPWGDHGWFVPGR